MIAHWNNRRRRRTFRFRALTGALVLLFAAGLAFSWRYRLIWVTGDSMQPTFKTGDVLVVDKWTYLRRPPARDDLVVACYHNEFVVKRVVGLPGEQIEVRLGRVEVDGVRQPTSYDFELGWLNIAPGRLLADRYAILGDNRGIAPASFVHAVVSPDRLLGMVVFAWTR